MSIAPAFRIRRRSQNQRMAYSIRFLHQHRHQIARKKRCVSGSRHNALRALFCGPIKSCKNTRQRPDKPVNTICYDRQAKRREPCAIAICIQSNTGNLWLKPRDNPRKQALPAKHQLPLVAAAHAPRLPACKDNSKWLLHAAPFRPARFGSSFTADKSASQTIRSAPARH